MRRLLLICGMVLGAGIIGAYLSRPQRTVAAPVLSQVPPSDGHDQKREDLPFETASMEAIPPARTPDGKPLALNAVAGDYSFAAGMGGRGLFIGADGASRNSFGACLASGESLGTVRVREGRLSFEALSVRGTPTGRTCLAVPVWWEGRLYILGPSERSMPGGLAEFCNAVNWGEEPRGPYDRHLPGHLFMLIVPIREGGHRPRNAIPEVASTWILAKPIEGAVLEVMPDRRARVALGRKDGVFKGMRLWAGETRDSLRLNVMAVDADTCVVETSRDWGTAKAAIGDVVRCDAAGAGGLER